MKYLIALCLTLVSLTAVHSQTLTSDVIQKRIVAVHAENSIAITSEGGSTKVMAVSENFSKGEANRSGVLAMNFAIGFFYAGDNLEKSPDSLLFTFWVLSKKPRFGESHSMTVTLPEEILVIGSARYNSKPREQMEYLNFEISRENLTKIAAQTEVSFQLGDEQFTFTRSQMKLLADVLMISDVGAVKE